MKRLNAQQLRTQEPDSEVAKSIKKNPITIICDNVLDTYNIGAIFRLADAVAAEKVYLCGATETPPNPKIKKASVSTWKWVDWEYATSTKAQISKLKFQNPTLKIIVVEQTKKSIPISKLKIDFPVAVVVGNETYGVTQDVVDIADTVVELPMFGINTSLNVMVSCGIVLYKLLEINRNTRSANSISP
jgi:23S rRNA (guanosine2251-2'-O)-methyltransferase